MSVVLNSIKRLFSGVWWVFTLTRSVVLNILFIVLFISLIAVFSNEEESITVPQKTALVLDLVGDLVEQKREVDPVDAFLVEAMGQKDKKPEILMADLFKTISTAKNDDRVKILVLQLQGLHSAGLSKIQDIGAALVDFKTSGKKIIAVADDFSQDQYYLASYADDIWMNPQGFMLLDGYGRYQMYFKSALEKLAVKQHIFRVGTFKSAVEPFIRDDMSAAAKEANNLWLNDLWAQYKHDVATQRGFTTDNFDESLDALLSKFSQSQHNFAQYAIDNHWVDQLKTRNEMRTALIALVGENIDGNSYSHIGFKDYLTATSGIKSTQQVNKDKIAIVVAKGNILNGTQQPGTIGGDSTAKLLRKARQNEQVKAVVLRVDSPGGSAFASEIIRQEIDLLKAAGKPVVASMGTYAASGGYWISAPTDKIYAAPSTITGSIGIFGMMMTFEESLSKLGIHTDGVGTTELTGFSPTRPLSDGMAQLFQLSINKGYQDFISLVATNRHMTLEQVDAIAQGRVWSGKKAKELGLVDELGNLTDAVKGAATLAKLNNYDTLLIEQEPSTRNKFIQQIMNGATKAVLAMNDNNQNDLLTSNGTTYQPITRLLVTIQQELHALNQFNDPQGIYTLCLACGVE